MSKVDVNSRAYFAGHAEMAGFRVRCRALEVEQANSLLADRTAKLERAKALQAEDARRFAAFERTGMTLDAEHGICRKPRCYLCELAIPQSVDQYGIVHGVLTAEPVVTDKSLTMATDLHVTDEAIAYGRKIAR